MAEDLVLALAQLNPVIGDLSGNLSKLQDARAWAAKQGAHLLVTPELYVCGYPPEDLVLKPSFQKAVQDAIHILAKATSDGGPAVLIGAPWVEAGQLHNAALMLDQGKITATISKRDLPNYGPFDEKRTFATVPLPEPVLFRGKKLGIMICEDVWTPDAAVHLAKQGAEILLVPNGSPYNSGKQAERLSAARQRIKETGLPLIYLNQIGGQDELVFDGNSFALDKNGACVLQMKAWDEDLACITLPMFSANKCAPTEVSEEETIYNALMLGLRDYVQKNRFPGVVLGLSGGIDSALVAALAVDALGADKVWGVMMPSEFTSRESREDAEALAKNLKCRYDVLPIADAMQAFDLTLRNLFTGKSSDTAEENIQARCRGVLLMALSNKFGPMVLATSNKSEAAVGYATLYGDMCGGFAVLKDVYKTQVYKIAQWRNRQRPATALGPDGVVMPERILTKAPTAELRHGQKDQDSLPPYDILDGILECLIEKDMSAEQTVKQGFDLALVSRVWKMLDRAEYKRRQAAPGVKITRRNFGKDRRYPITNRYSELN